MDEHLVRSHLGGYYISSLDPEFIEAYCDTCGDYDEIEVSWNSEDENEKINSLANFFSRESIKSEEEFDKIINSFEDIENLAKEDMFDMIIDDISFNNDASQEIIEFLYENKDLNETEYTELINRNKEELKKQFIIVKKNINKYINSEKDINKTKKKLSLYLKQG